MIFDPNPLFYKMVQLFKKHYSKEQKVVICNEGGSRSSKTFDTFHLLIYICDQNRGTNLDIYILRDTLIHCRDFTFKDFLKVLAICQIYDQATITTSPKPYINLWGNNIYFRGLDDESNAEGYPSDILFFNEALETQKTKVDGLFMRCRKLIVMDWNPKFTDHWCFDLEGQPNVFFTKTTYKNNKHLEQTVINTIESYCPWHFDDLHLPESQRRPHPVNVDRNTANLFRWMVYGQGMRAALEGLVFPDVTYIDEFPNDVEKVFFGLDFGFTNDPTALVMVGVNGRDIYAKELLYTPFDNANELSQVIAPLITTHCWADISDRGMIASMQQKGLKVFAAKKFPGCIEWRIDIIKRYRLNVVRSKNFKKELENYFYKTVNGICLNVPDTDSKYCHLIDALGYAVQHELR